jgi:hypothetical protein
MSEKADDKPAGLERGQLWLDDVSDAVLERGADLATETDRWFVQAVQSVSQSAQRAHDGFGAVTQAALARWSRLRPRFDRRAPRERIRDLLHREARRLDFDVSRPDFTEFSEKMAMLLELVFNGALKVEDVAFDSDDTAGAGSVEAAEEVADQDQSDQYDEGEPLRVQEQAAVDAASSGGAELEQEPAGREQRQGDQR